MPVLSGVAPFPYFNHANMLLQICMPRSFTILVFTTRLPLAAMMLAKAHPNRLLRTCPKCKGLLVLGIFRIFPRSSRFIWPCHNFIDTFRIVAWTCIVSLDQETDAVILSCIGEARLEANLRIIYKDGHLRFKRDGCQLF